MAAVSEGRKPGENLTLGYMTGCGGIANRALANRSPLNIFAALIYLDRVEAPARIAGRGRWRVEAGRREVVIGGWKTAAGGRGETIGEATKVELLR
jgi:hypothetical protein